MESILELIKDLKNKGIDLSLTDGENLEVTFDGNVLPETIIAVLREKKPEIVAVLKELNISLSDAQGIQKVEEQPHYELSSSQKRLWLLSKFEASNIAYNTQGGYMFEGPLNLEALRRAFDELLERHEVFRTVFKNDENADVKQYILSRQEAGFTIEFQDLQDNPQRETILKKDVQSRTEQAFDLTTGPLISVKVYQLEEQKFFLSYVLHHIIADGWSMQLLPGEIMTMYQAFIHGEKNPLKPLEIQYKDFVAWQQNQLRCENLKNHRGYWLGRFQGEIPVLNLIGDYSRPPIRSYQGKTMTTVIEVKTLERLKSLCKSEGVSLFVGLISMVNALLSRLTNQTDIVIGSPTAGREHLELENQMGLYLNMLALRSQFEKNTPFNELLQKVKEVVLGAYEHQVYPFDELLDELKLKKDPARNPLFDVVVVLQNLAIASKLNQQNTVQKTTDPLKLQVERMNVVEAKASKFDLTFDFQEFEGGLGVKLEFNTDIFATETATQIMGMFCTLAVQVGRDHTISIDRIDFLTEQQSTQVNQFNNTDRAYDQDATIVSMFKKQVQSTPNQVALKFEQRQYTFSEIDELSGKLATFLKARNAGYQVLVGIHQERSEWMIISILAILKLGAAYLPLDKDYPEDRIAYMLKDSGALLIVHEAMIEEFMQEIDQLEPFEETVRIAPHDLIYCMYTSGSTGNPKGILIEHRSVVNLVTVLEDNFRFDENDVVLSLSTMSFDAFVPELFFPLTHGIKVVLGNRDAQRSPQVINELLKTEQVTFTQLTPSRLLTLLDEGACFDSVNCLMIAGEVFPNELYLRLIRSFKGTVLNGYGPSETCVYATISNVTKTPVNIGKPIGNTKIYVVNNHMKMQGIGVPGEICISGPGVGRGYKNNQEFNAAKFIQDPFNEGQKMYLSGDLGRWNDDGTIHYLGRKDDQVKIRGYRVELGEIENLLLNHPMVNTAVATIRQRINGEKVLVAYVKVNGSVTSKNLRETLAKHLPMYLIPELFVEVEAFDYTPSGKIDRNKLPNPEGLEMDLGVKYVKPENETQEKLTLIWQQVLHQESIGILESFFDLGGNSLQLVKMVDKVRVEFQRNVNYIDAFKFPNIEELAEYLDNNKQKELEVFDELVDDAVDIMDETFNILKEEKE